MKPGLRIGARRAGAESDLTRQILSLQQGAHLCLFYEKHAAEQMPALVPFIQGDRLYYNASRALK
jgi:hypothetical protein